MDKKRVLIIGHTYTAPVNRLKFDIMAEDERFEFLLVTPRKWKNYVTIADNSTDNSDGKYRISFVNVWFGFHPVTYIIPSLGKIIRDFKPQLIYCEQEIICLVSLQAAILVRSIPIIYFTWENIDRKDLYYRLFSIVRFLCLKRSVFMVAGTNEAASVLRQNGYKKEIYITPILGVSEDLFFPQKKRPLRNEHTAYKFLIGYIGRFVEQKGIETLISAVSNLNSDIDWHLVLLGGGPMKKRYEELIRELNIQDKVTFHKAVPHDEVPDFIRSLHVLVLPSKTTKTWKEQFGHVLIEAMACGVPVIGSSSGAIPGVIKNAGLVFDETKVNDLQSKTNRLINNKLLQINLIERGFKRVKNNYTDKQIASNMIRLYELAFNLKTRCRNTIQIV